MEHLHTGTGLIISDYLVDSVLYSVKCTSDGPHSNHAKIFVLNSIQTELKVVTKFSPANDGCEVRLDRSCDERRSVIIHGENAHSRFAFGTDDGFACKGKRDVSLAPQTKGTSCFSPGRRQLPLKQVLRPLATL